MTEFERGWRAALEAARAWHEGKAKQIPGRDIGLAPAAASP